MESTKRTIHRFDVGEGFADEYLADWVHCLPNLFRPFFFGLILSFLLPMSAKAATTGFTETSAIVIGYHTENVGVDHSIYQNPNVVCARIADQYNSDENRIWTYINPWWMVHPQYGHGCVYDMVFTNGTAHPIGTVLEDVYQQHYVLPVNGCAAGYSGPNQKKVDSSYYWYCTLTKIAPSFAQPATSEKICQSLVGNPIAAGSAMKVQLEKDVSSPQVKFERRYRGFVKSGYNDKETSRRWGYRWYDEYSQKIEYTGSIATQYVVFANRPDGSIILFKLTDETWSPDTDISERLEELKDASGTRTGWRLYGTDGVVEEYDEEGRLTNLTDSRGLVTELEYSTIETISDVVPTEGLLIKITLPYERTLQLSYDTYGRVVRLIDPTGQVYLYEYDGSTGTADAGNLTSVTYPDGTVRYYHYENETYVNALTGITDENGARYATYGYADDSKATSTEHANGADKLVLTYNTDSTTATDAFETTRTYNFQTILGVIKYAGQSQPGGSGCGAATSALTYDDNGNVATRTDFNGNVTTYVYDTTRNLETSRTEASGKSKARTISTSWHSYWRLPIKVAEPKKVTTYVYNGDDGNYCAPTDATLPSIAGGTQPIGVLCQKTEQATTDVNGSQGLNPTVTGTARVWKYTYDRYGQVLTATDPNNHTTTNTYYAADDASIGNRGNLHTSTNAAGHTTTYSNYDANGRVGTIVDANGLTTTLTYSPRGWLTSKVVAGGGTTESTTYTYDGVGQMTKVSLPDGAEITYTYDDAHRLTAITDKLGNSINYTLDAMGNRTKEEVKDPSGNLARQVTRVYDALNRLEAITGGGL